MSRPFHALQNNDTLKPFSPAEAKAFKINVIPSFVIEAMNTLLAENFDGIYGCTLLPDDFVERIEQLQALDNVHASVKFQTKWLDIEPLYRDRGWSVTYEKPGYNESGRAFFVFKIGDQS